MPTASETQQSVLDLQDNGKREEQVRPSCFAALSGKHCRELSSLPHPKI